jgi:hypothetical protein
VLAAPAGINLAAKRHPNRTAAELELRQAHMDWGPRKLKRILERDRPRRPESKDLHLRRFCCNYEPFRTKFKVAFS